MGEVVNCGGQVVIVQCAANGARRHYNRHNLLVCRYSAWINW
jgi:hypothetical protein